MPEYHPRKYGSPQKARREQLTLTVDLPRDIASVSEVDGDRPPMKVYGPVEKDEAFHEAAEQLPVAVDIKGATAQFHFNPAIGQGHYRVVVYLDRFEAEDGHEFELFDEEAGRPWTGWFMDIVESTERYGPAPPQVETRTKEAPEQVEVEVFLDGRPAPQVEASGEVLTVVTSEPAKVHLSTRPIMSGHHSSLYEEWLTRTSYDLEDGRAAVSFTSAGPVEDYKWAKYHPMDSVGVLPMDTDRSLLVGEPVIRRPEPAVVDPHIDRDVSIGYSKEGHENLYKRLRYTITPHEPESLLSEYTSKDILSPELLREANNTPDRNQNLFPGAAWREELVGPEALIGVFDLPLHTEIGVEVNGQRRFVMQTRLMPVMVPVDRVRSELGLDGGRSDKMWLQDIWQASMRALNLWGCKLPASGQPTPSMIEYVLMRLLHDPQRRDGAQGTQSATIGSQSTTVKSDRAASRRIANIADLLQDCEHSVPFDVEDQMYSTSAGVAADQNFQHFAAPSRHQVARRLMPIYSPYMHNTYSKTGQFQRLGYHA